MIMAYRVSPKPIKRRKNYEKYTFKKTKATYVRSEPCQSCPSITKKAQ